MARKSKQLDADIAAALAKGSPHPEATPSDWKKLMDDVKARFYKADAQQKAVLQEEYKAAQVGLRAAEQTAAKKPSFVTGTNLSALTRLVVDHGGPEFPNRIESVSIPHIKRTMAAGLVESVGNKLRLTPTGREMVGDEIIKDIARESGWTPSENTFVPVERRAAVLAKDVAEHNAKIKRLEDALASLKR